MKTRTIIALALAALALRGCSNTTTDIPWLKPIFGGASGTELVAMVFDPDDPDKRREGIVGLAKKTWGLREPHLKGFALRLEIDRDPSVRSAAVRALGMAGDPKYLSNILTALEDKSPAVRWDAAVALQSVVYGTSAIEPLSRHAVEDASVDAKVSCIKALGNYRRPEVAATLLKCMSDPSFIVRYEAHKLLVQMTGRDMGKDPRDWANVDLPHLSAPSGKPWWDWMGVTKKPPEGEPTAASGPASAPASGPAKGN